MHRAAYALAAAAIRPFQRVKPFETLPPLLKRCHLLSQQHRDTHSSRRPSDVDETIFEESFAAEFFDADFDEERRLAVAASESRILRRNMRPTFVCYQCKQSGHMARDCTNPHVEYRRGGDGPPPSVPLEEESSVKLEAGTGRVHLCYRCGRQGHKARACPFHDPPHRN